MQTDAGFLRLAISVRDLRRAVWHSGGGRYRAGDDAAGLQDPRAGEHVPLPGADRLHHPADVLDILAGALRLQRPAQADRRDRARAIPAVWRSDDYLAGRAPDLGGDCDRSADAEPRPGGERIWRLISFKHEA